MERKCEECDNSYLEDDDSILCCYYFDIEYYERGGLMSNYQSDFYSPRSCPKYSPKWWVKMR